MNYCSECGKPVAQRVPEGDDRLRYICDHCDTIHYQNPRVVVGCLITEGDKILLCRRAIEPRKNFWTIPAGFMENGETMLQGALRESQEEACAEVQGETLYRLFDIPRINQVYVFYRGTLKNGAFDAGPESLEVRLFDEDEIPWSELAFPVVTDLLMEYLEDRKTGQYPVRIDQPGPLWAEHTGWNKR
ncbi:NUDIX hydrolase [Litorivivens sp.]|uniref:NUDIX hydrolase n=2 Tax=Litorivivens sp. TaxID=2020868 RepID=UPI003563EB69